MFKEEVSHFISIKIKPQNDLLIVGTKNTYECSISALLIGGDWYALVENPDWSRRYDIDELIGSEFGARTEGWCVLKASHHALGRLIAFQKGEEHIRDVTFQDGSYSCWLLEMKPLPGSRLLQFERGTKRR